jgi:hypothetical protein
MISQKNIQRTGVKQYEVQDMEEEGDASKSN